jgi:hypothetical protein
MEEPAQWMMAALALLLSETDHVFLLAGLSPAFQVLPYVYCSPSASPKGVVRQQMCLRKTTDISSFQGGEIYGKFHRMWLQKRQEKG